MNEEVAGAEIPCSITIIKIGDFGVEVEGEEFTSRCQLARPMLAADIGIHVACSRIVEIIVGDVEYFVACLPVEEGA